MHVWCGSRQLNCLFLCVLLICIQWWRTNTPRAPSQVLSLDLKQTGSWQSADQGQSLRVYKATNLLGWGLCAVYSSLSENRHSSIFSLRPEVTSANPSQATTFTIFTPQLFTSPLLLLAFSRILYHICGLPLPREHKLCEGRKPYYFVRCWLCSVWQCVEVREAFVG